MEAEPQNLDDLVEICKHTLKAILDNHAPMKKRSITIRCTVPWFTTEIIAQKRMVRRREKIWCKYGQNHQWQALKIECSKHKSMLKVTKKATLSEKITECGRDSKKYTILYQISQAQPKLTQYQLLALMNKHMRLQSFYWQNQQN